MPDEKSKIKFDYTYLKRVDRAILVNQKMINLILPKYRAGMWGKNNSVHERLLIIKSYAFYNIGQVPPIEKGEIKYDQYTLIKIRNAKSYLIAQYKLIQPAKAREIGAEYSKALDLFNQFQTHLEGVTPPPVG